MIIRPYFCLKKTLLTAVSTAIFDCIKKSSASVKFKFSKFIWRATCVMMIKKQNYTSDFLKREENLKVIAINDFVKTRIRFDAISKNYSRVCFLLISLPPAFEIRFWRRKTTDVWRKRKKKKDSKVAIIRGTVGEYVAHKYDTHGYNAPFRISYPVHRPSSIVHGASLDDVTWHRACARADCVRKSTCSVD